MTLPEQPNELDQMRFEDSQIASHPLKVGPTDTYLGDAPEF